MGESQKDILRWHCRLGHIRFLHLGWLALYNKIPVKNPTAVANCDKVVCAACEFGKSSKLPDGADKTKTREDKKSEINKADFFPCQRISIDQYQSDFTGRIYISRGGNYNPINMYRGGEIFTNH